MVVKRPTGKIDRRYSDAEAEVMDWSQARDILEKAETYWVTTIRPDGRPHQTPLMAVWQDDALYFSTGVEERKARNLRGNTHCLLATGCNHLNEGVDVVLEGNAQRVQDDSRLQQLADLWVAKYGEEWRFQARDGAFQHEQGSAHVFEVRPRTVFAFGKGHPFNQTRWLF